MSKVKIRLIRSLIGANKKQLGSAQALGLKKIGQEVIRENDKVTEGYIRSLAHLLETEEVDA